MPSYQNRATGEIVQGTAEDMAYAQGWDELQQTQLPVSSVSAPPPSWQSRFEEGRGTADKLSAARSRLRAKVTNKQLLIILLPLALLIALYALLGRTDVGWGFALVAALGFLLFPFIRRLYVKNGKTAPNTSPASAPKPSATYLRLILVGIAVLFFGLATNARTGSEWVFLLLSVSSLVLMPFVGKILDRIG